PTAPAPARKWSPRDFQFGRLLGEGSYATVHYAREEKYAGVELAALLRLKHPLIVTLHFRFKDDERLYFVLEFAKNGDLLGWIRKLGSFDVPTARFYFAEIVLATRYMHEQNVLHRDLKPENILIAEDFHIRVTDFGSAKILDAPPPPTASQASSIRSGQSGRGPARVPRSGRENRGSFVGTAEYCSPEMLNDQPVTAAADVWALGCILYQMLAGRPPFKEINEYLTFQKIVKLDYTIPEAMDADAADLIRQILVLDPEARPDLDAVLAHPFLAPLD
ncbi:hypothetical protein CXG81DRAFT_7690, partial [Caulochytrium protostelioides]